MRAKEGGGGDLDQGERATRVVRSDWILCISQKVKLTKSDGKLYKSRQEASPHTL